MLDNILIASDLSAASDCLIRCAAGLRRLGSRKALLVHALCMRHYRDMREVVEPMIEPRLRAQAEVLERAGFEVAVQVLPGQACEEVLKAARGSGADAIVMATRSGSLAHDLLVGNTVLRVLGHSGKPVLVMQARHEDPLWSCCRQTGAWIGDSVLYPTDFSDTAELAFEWVRRLASSGASRVTLLHVQAPGRRQSSAWRGELDRIDAARLSRLAGELRQIASVSVEGLLREGAPAEEILRAAGELGATLIVMGTQGRGLVHEVFLGSVSHQVLRHAPVPVLLSPAAREDEAAGRSEDSASAPRGRTS